MKVTVQLSLPADASLLGPTRRVFTGYLNELGVDSEEMDEVVLALDEACANVVRHAYPDGEADGDSVIDLTAELSPHEVVMCVEDRGRGIDPAVEADRPSPQAVSGRGLHIIEHVMSSVDVQRIDDTGTRVVMRKRLRSG